MHHARWYGCRSMWSDHYWWCIAKRSEPVVVRKFRDMRVEKNVRLNVICAMRADNATTTQKSCFGLSCEHPSSTNSDKEYHTKARGILDNYVFIQITTSHILYFHRHPQHNCTKQQCMHVMIVTCPIFNVLKSVELM